MKEVSERLRALGSSKLCIDLIQCDPEIRPAVQYAVENTVVCETLDDARDLCFRKKEKVKAVTLDGSVISKAGTMTGGNAPRDAGGASRWDGQLHAQLKLRRDNLLQAVGKLGGRRDNSLISELQTKITQLNTKEQYALKDLKLTNEKMAGLQKQSQELKQQILHLEKEKQKVQPAISDRESIIATVQARVQSHEDETFSAFSRRIGVSSIREFEEGHLRVLQENNENRRQLREQRAKLEAQLQYEKTKDFASPLSKIEKRLAQTKLQLRDGEALSKSLSKDEKSLRGRFGAAETARDEAKSNLEEKEIEVKALQNERADCSKERVSILKKITAEETAIEQLRGKLHTILQKAKVEEVSLPMVSGGGEDMATSDSASQQSEATASTHLSQKDNGQVVNDRAESERIDFSELKRHRDVAAKQLESVRADYEKKVADLRAEIEQMQPNMKVLTNQRTELVSNFKLRPIHASLPLSYFKIYFFFFICRQLSASKSFLLVTKVAPMILTKLVKARSQRLQLSTR